MSQTGMCVSSSQPPREERDLEEVIDLFNSLRPVSASGILKYLKDFHDDKVIEIPSIEPCVEPRIYHHGEIPDLYEMVEGKPYLAKQLEEKCTMVVKMRKIQETKERGMLELAESHAHFEYVKSGRVTNWDERLDAHLWKIRQFYDDRMFFQAMALELDRLYFRIKLDLEKINLKENDNLTELAGPLSSA